MKILNTILSPSEYIILKMKPQVVNQKTLSSLQKISHFMFLLGKINLNLKTLKWKMCLTLQMSEATVNFQFKVPQFTLHHISLGKAEQELQLIYRVFHDFRA
jgi:hypothetical protein